MPPAFSRPNPFIRPRTAAPPSGHARPKIISATASLPYPPPGPTSLPDPVIMVPGGALSPKPAAATAGPAGHPHEALKMGSFGSLKVIDSNRKTTRKWVRLVKTRGSRPTSPRSSFRGLKGRMPPRGSDWLCFTSRKLLIPRLKDYKIGFVSQNPLPHAPPKADEMCRILSNTVEFAGADALGPKISNSQPGFAEYREIGNRISEIGKAL